LSEHKQFKFIKGDICDFDLLSKLTQGIDYVFHQAAWGSVPRSFIKPLDYEQNNIKGTLNIFEASRINKVKKVIYASSSSVYGDSSTLPKVEGQEGNLLSPYALTKKVTEMYGQIYWKQFGLPTIGLRYFNVFGPRQDPNGQYAAIIPKFILSMLNNDNINIYGDGSHSRDFTFIENVLKANYNSAIYSTENSYGEAFNIAFGQKYTLLELYYELASLLNYNKKPIFTSPREGDIKESLANISKANNLLKYDPKIDFKSGLNLTVDWYKKIFKVT
jgi:UDP-N-acetylglucosamine 4-epimerase